MIFVPCILAFSKPFCKLEERNESKDHKIISRGWLFLYKCTLCLVLYSWFETFFLFEQKSNQIDKVDFLINILCLNRMRYESPTLTGHLIAMVIGSFKGP